jgi:hypothetical protein
MLKIPSFFTIKKRAYAEFCVQNMTKISGFTLKKLRKFRPPIPVPEGVKIVP